MDVEDTTMEEAFGYLTKCLLTGTISDILFVVLNVPGINGFTFKKEFEEK